MTSVLKSAVTYDASFLVQGQTADATDVIAATDDLLDNDKAGRVAISAADTYLKNLEDAIDAGDGISVTKVNTAADESLAIAVNSSVVRLTAAQALTNKTMASGAGNAIAVGALAQSGAVNGDVPTWNGSAYVPAPPGGAAPAAPVDVTLIVAGEALSERDFVYLSATGWKKVDIDASPVAMGRTRGIVNQVGGIANGALGSVRLIGEVTGFVALTANAFVWASTTAGSYTQTKPAPSLGGSQVAVVPIGLAVSTTRILLMGPARMQYRKRASTANNGTILIEHHDDPFGEGRLPRAFVTSSSTSTIQSYDSSNLSGFLVLKGAVGAGATVTPDSAGTFTISIGDQSGSEFMVAQSVVLTAGYLSQVSFFLDASTGSPVGPMTVEIRANNAGIPATTALWTYSHTPTASSNNVISSISDGPLFAAGTYWLVLSVAAQATNNNYKVRFSNTNPYASGSLKADVNGAGTWGTGGANDDMRCSVVTSASIVYDRISQSFLHSSTASVPTASLYLKKFGTPTDNLTLGIYSDSAGSPGTLIASSSAVATSSLTTSYVLTPFAFSPDVSLSASTTYHMVLSTSGSGSASNYVQVGVDTTASSYANGVAKYEASAAWTAVGGDLIFAVTATVPVYAEPCVIGRDSGGTRDVAVRYDSGVLGVNTATNTQGKNVSGGTLDLTFVVEMD